MSASCFVVSFRIAAISAQACYDALLFEAPSVSSREINDQSYEIALYFEEDPGQEIINGLLIQFRDVITDLQIGTFDASILSAPGYLPVKEQQLGPFHIQDISIPFVRSFKHRYTIRISAGEAFGTGDHATTSGCLTMLGKLAKQGFKPKTVLDIGTGTGILAIAASKSWPSAHVIGTDIDKHAVTIARSNARINNVHHHIHVLFASGFSHPLVKRHHKVDLVVANILALPLISMAKDLGHRLNPGGKILLSGILISQEPALVAHYKACGFRVVERIRREPWSVLSMER